MESVGIDVVLFLFGAVFLCIGLYGRIETQWFKVGSDSSVIRVSSGLIGTLLISVALIKAEILPFGNVGKLEQLRKENAALQKTAMDLKAKLTQQQAVTATSKALIEQAQQDVSSVKNEASTRQQHEAVTSLVERLSAAIEAIGDPEKMRKVDPTGEVASADGDNSISTARTISLGEQITAEIRPFTDRDYYKVLLQPNVAGPLRLILRKLDPQGLVTEIVLYDENERVLEKKRSHSDPTVSFTFPRPSGKHFYLHVASQGLPSVYSITPQQGPYQLIVRAE
jgi:hypothetical protein